MMHFITEATSNNNINFICLNFSTNFGIVSYTCSSPNSLAAVQVLPKNNINYITHASEEGMELLVRTYVRTYRPTVLLMCIVILMYKYILLIQK